LKLCIGGRRERERGVKNIYTTFFVAWNNLIENIVRVHRHIMQIEGIKELQQKLHLIKTAKQRRRIKQCFCV
jgi:ribosomal protein S15P/S13E